MNSHSAAGRVWIVEDNEDLVDDVVFHLGLAGHQVRAFGDGVQLDQALATCAPGEAPEVLIIDLGLPGEDGLSIAQRVRTACPAMGIVMLTARTRLHDRIAGHRFGADNYLCKPVEMAELVAVVDARINVRRLQAPKASPCWQLNLSDWQLHAPDGSAQVSLTGSELVVLRAMAEAEGHEIDRPGLVAALGRDHAEYDERRLERIISRLRHKLATLTGGRSLVRGVRNKGYVFVEPIEIR